MKPWLAAKTAGDALLEAQACASHKGFASWCDFEAACVIEWHEAQRVKVCEWWETYCMHKKCSEYDTRPGLRAVKCRKSDGCYVIHVTRYRRNK